MDDQQLIKDLVHYATLSNQTISDVDFVKQEELKAVSFKAEQVVRAIREQAEEEKDFIRNDIGDNAEDVVGAVLDNAEIEKDAIRKQAAKDKAKLIKKFAALFLILTVYYNKDVLKIPFSVMG
jgi:methionine synthase I (cobalamin-dependent)